MIKRVITIVTGLLVCVVAFMWGRLDGLLRRDPLAPMAVSRIASGERATREGFLVSEEPYCWPASTDPAHFYCNVRVRRTGRFGMNAYECRGASCRLRWGTTNIGE